MPLSVRLLSLLSLSVGVSACTSLSLALFHSRPLHRPSVSLTAPFSTRIVSLSPFLERVLLSPSISYSIVLSLPLSLSLLFVFLLLLLLLFRRLLALFFLVSCARTREYACTECLSLPFSCAFGAPRHCEEAANYRRYTRLTRAH